MIYSPRNPRLVIPAADKLYEKICRYNKRLILLDKIWLGREDSNLRMVESKSTALPLGDAPTTEERDGKRLPRPLFGHAGL